MKAKLATCISLCDAHGGKRKRSTSAGVRWTCAAHRKKHPVYPSGEPQKSWSAESTALKRFRFTALEAPYEENHPKQKTTKEHPPNNC